MDSTNGLFFKCDPQFDRGVIYFENIAFYRLVVNGYATYQISIFVCI